MHFFLGVRGTFSTVDHVLDHKTSLNKFKRTKIILSIFSNYNGINLEFNYIEKTIKFAKIVVNKQHAIEQSTGQGRLKRNINTP